MSQAIHEPVVPKGGVLAAAALILFALATRHDRPVERRTAKSA